MDDNPAVLDGLRRLLSPQVGLTVVAVAGDGREALAQVANHQPDLVVMDIRLPGLGGLDAAAEMRRRFPQVRIVMISVQEDTHLLRECLRCGADLFLPKIGLQRTLLPEIRQLFADGPPHASASA